jgi:hypothetical protein
LAPPVSKLTHSICRFTFGSNRIQLRADLQAIDELLGSVTSDVIGLDATVTSFHDVAFARLPGARTFTPRTTLKQIRLELTNAGMQGLLWPRSSVKSTSRVNACSESCLKTKQIDFGCG